jgi:hypothetical protein
MLFFEPVLLLQVMATTKKNNKNQTMRYPSPVELVSTISFEILRKQNWLVFLIILPYYSVSYITIYTYLVGG